MFTGIVSDLGVLASEKPSRGLKRLRISCRYPARGIALGASILCDGVCMTVVAKGGELSLAGFGSGSFPLTSREADGRR